MNRIKSFDPGIWFILALMGVISLTTSCKDDEYPVPPASTVASFTFTESNNGYAPCEITFTNTSVNALGYTWDFGNGETSTELNPVVIYNDPGTYNVSLTCVPQNNVYYNKLVQQVPINIKDPNAGKTPVLYFTTRSPDGGNGHYVILDGNAPVIIDFIGTGLGKPYGIDADTAHQKVYISDSQDGVIYSYDADGKNQVKILDKNLPGQEIVDYPYGMMVVGDKIYWGREGGIYMANLDGSSPQAAFDFGTSPPELPLDFEYDAVNQKIWFINDMYDFSGGLWVINLDGTGLTEIIPSLDATALDIDFDHGKVYLAAYAVSGTPVTENGIYRCNLDGSGMMKIGDFGEKATWGISHNPETGNLYWSYKISNSDPDGKIIQSWMDGSAQTDWITNISPQALKVTKIKL